MVLSINTGKGMGFNGNKLTTVWNDENGNIEKREDGLYVPDLKGDPGGNGGTVVDNYTITIDSNNRLRANLDVVQCIYSMSAYVVTNRTSSSSYTTDRSQVKSISDIINECNAIIDNNGPRWTTYDMSVGDLFQLRDSATPTKYSTWPVAIDDGNRYNGQSCLALFVVTAIDNNNHYTNSLSLQCLWSSLSQYTKGTIYSS